MVVDDEIYGNSAIAHCLDDGGLCFAIGVAVGGILFKLYSPEQSKARDLEKHLHDKQDELKNYQHEVTEHFTETSKLLKDLTENYRDVHNHLAKGAQVLCESSNTPPIMYKLPEVDMTGDDDEKDSIAAPLDYAPRSTPYDKGTLHEDYGLEKIELDEKPIEDIAEAIAENAKAANTND